jgi:regulator of protease activity HflC (stomatin/prohibitin superfamily)
MRLKLLNQNFYRQLAVMLLVVLVLLLGGAAEFHHRHMNLADQLGLTELPGDVPFVLKATLMLTNVLVLVIKLLPGTIFNSLPAVAALVVVPWAAARFIQALYDTKDLKEARAFLQRTVLGMNALRPLMIVKEGCIALGGGSLCDRVGGPSLMIVYNNSAVVLEKGGRLTRVVGGPYLGFIEPFERVYEIVDLRPQRWQLTDSAMTKEGIPVAWDADVTFKIDDRYADEQGQVRTKMPSEAKTELLTDKEIADQLKLDASGIGMPLPYTEEAVFKAATSTWVRIRQTSHKEQLRKWTGRVIIGGVEGALRSILFNYRLDWLLRPTRTGQKHPRDEIREQLEQKLLKSFPAGNDVGAKILNVDLGKIDVDEKISTQWIEAWRVGWEQRVMDTQVEGEAALARLDAARIEAQAELALTLTEAIRPLVAGGEEITSYLLAMRFVETLQWMAYDPYKRVFLPPETLRTLAELEKTLKKSRTYSEETPVEIGRLLTEMVEVRKS